MDSLIETFHIDIKLIIAQIINFGIVFLVLYYLILKPLLRIMKEREGKIQDGLKFSEQVERDVKEIQEKRSSILAEAKVKADMEIAEAKKIAEVKGAEILDKAQKQAQEIVMIAKVQGDDERQKIVDKSKQEVLHLAFAVATRVLGKKIGEKEDKELTQKFIKEI